MKYKLSFYSDFDGSINLVNKRGDFLICIYWPDSIGANDPSWPDGFWYCPDWSSNDKGQHRKANVDYHKHRDEYIQEAKKLMVKDML